MDDHQDMSAPVPRLQVLFERAIGLSSSKRRAMLERLVQTEPELAEELVTLIAASSSIEEIKPLVRFEAVIPDAPTRARAFQDGEAVSTPVGPGRVVRLLSSPYRIGQTEVYEVCLDAGQRRVALKLLRAEVSAGELGRRFRVEAQTHAMLDHPGIASMLGAGAASGQAGTTHPAIVTALVEGETFDQWASRDPPVRQVAGAIAEIARAVHFANIRGIVHRDLKPQNIMVDGEGRTRILDLGIAKLTDQTHPGKGQSLVSIGESVLGTPRYMAPEQFTPTTRKVDLLADVYALGCILYESLTGHPPVEVEGLSMVETADAKRETRVPVPRISGVPSDLIRCAARACAPMPSDRYESCQALAIDIERALGGLPLILQPPSPARRLWLLMRRRPLMTALVLLLILIVAASGAAYVGLQGRIARERDRAVHRFDETRSFANWVIFDLDRMLSSLPGTADARHELINHAGMTLDALTADPKADDDLLLGIIDARLRLADVLVWELGDSAKGDEQLKYGLLLLDQLEHPQSPRAQIRRAWIDHCRTYSMGIVSGPALEEINMHAIRVFERFEPEFVGYAPYWRWRADAEWKGTRRLIVRHADADEVLKMGRAAIDHADRAAALDPDDPFNLAEAVITRFWLAHAKLDLKDPSAMESVDQASEAAQGLIDSNHRFGLSYFALAKLLRGRILAAQGHPEDAVKEMADAVDIHDAAVGSDPGNIVIYRRAEVGRAFLAEIYLTLARQGDPSAAEEGLRYIRGALERLEHRYAMGWLNPGELRYRDEYTQLEQRLMDAAAGIDPARAP